MDRFKKYSSMNDFALVPARISYSAREGENLKSENRPMLNIMKTKQRNLIQAISISEH